MENQEFGFRHVKYTMDIRPQVESSAGHWIFNVGSLRRVHG